MRAARSILVLAAFLIVPASGCYKTVNHGRGNCKEYEPYCIGGGELECTRDDRGCEICTCMQNGGPYNPLD